MVIQQTNTKYTQIYGKMRKVFAICCKGVNSLGY